MRITLGCVLVEKKSAKGQSFMKGTLVLTLSIFIVKLLGILFRIFVNGMLGASGGGYFLISYDIYNMLFALATAGLPIAVSRMVSENLACGRFKDVRKIYEVSIPMFTITGIIGFLLMVVGAIAAPYLFKVPGAVYSVLALAPTILFACLMSIYRGYHQGLRNMTPTAVSEIIEALFKFVVGYALSYGIIKFAMDEYTRGGTVFGSPYATQELAKAAIMPFASAGAVIGISVGAAMGFLYLFFRQKIKGDCLTPQDIRNSPKAHSKEYLFRCLVKLAVPIGIGAIILNIAGFIDDILILNRIQHVMATNREALLSCYGAAISQHAINSSDGVHNFLLGCYSFTLPITMLVPAITQVFGIVALPTVTKAFTLKNPAMLKKGMESVIKMTTLVTLPAGIGLSVIGPALLRLLFPRQVNEITIASNIMPIIGIATIFISATIPICSMLQAIGRVDLPVKIISAGLAIKVFVNFVLVGIPTINIQGAAIGTSAGYLFIMVVSLYYLCRETKIIPDFVEVLIKPLIAAILCGVAAFISNSLLSRDFVLVVSIFSTIFISAVTYLIALFGLGAVGEDEIKMLPYGEKFVKVLAKFKCLV